MGGRRFSFERVGDGATGRGIGRRTVLGTALAGLAGAAVPLGAGQELPRTLELQSRTDRVEYEFTVSEDVEFGSTAGDGDEIDGNTVVGVINGVGSDDYRFAGEITAFEVTVGEAQVDVLLDGEAVDPDSLGDGDVAPTDPPTFPHLLTVEALSEEVEYSIVLDGKFDPDGASGEVGEFDEEDEGAVAGELAEGETATYAYFGPVVTAEVTEGVASLDVERGPPRATVREEERLEDPLPYRVLFFGLDDSVKYRFSATGEVVFGDAAEEQDTAHPAEEQVDENTVEGWVHAHDGDPMADDFYFDGDPTVERAEAPVRVKLKW